MSETTFAPDSSYATWTPAQRAASARMEDQFNSNRARDLALRDEKLGHTVRGMTDDMLRRLAITYARTIEDIEAGDEHGTPARVRMIKAQIRDIEREQAFRGALAESWLASEDGTHCYSSFQARGGLAAVLNHGAPAPTYDLAVLLDCERHLRGLSTVLDWVA